MSFRHIQKQGHSIHTFDGIIEICKAYDHAVIMAGVKEDTLLKLNGTLSIVMNSHDSSTLLA